MRGELRRFLALHLLERRRFVFDCVEAAEDFAARGVSSAPDRSIATIVLANVGAAVCSAIASISASCCFIPSSIAGCSRCP